MKLLKLLIVPILPFALTGCQEKAQFESIDSAWSGLDFRNDITETVDLNALNFEYIYNGSGVGVGDFNNDGLSDVFFTGSQVPCRLYLNKGGMQFEDVTTAAGIVTPWWSTGVSLVDINQDGLLDIYIANVNPRVSASSPNQFLINQGVGPDGIPTFQDRAVDMGLADKGYSTQGAFFDYDLDGDLDMYLLTNALESFDRSLARTAAHDGTGRSNDRLYRNDGAGEHGLPYFVNVTKEAGITTEGWGLGVSIIDINNDGWPDVYCANDFLSNDLLWINQGDGTFSNRISDFIRHQTHNSMGMDIADINNDGRPDILNLDMMPEDNLRQKTMFSRPNYDYYNHYQTMGYQPQFVRNSLQLNRGADHNGWPQFSEIGYLAGVYATDWSWSALLADFDNDGYRDIYITNGYRKDVTNLDFVNYSTQNYFTYKRESDETREARAAKIESLFGVKKPNFMFRNSGNLNFEDVTARWGLKIPSYSNGAAYADFDNDGDLDIVINNIDDQALLLKNNLIESEDEGGNFLQVELQGKAGNSHGIGAVVNIFYAGGKQHIQHSPYRGYKSTVDPTLHFGLGEVEVVDSVEVIWPGGNRQVIRNVQANQKRVLRESEATGGLRKKEISKGGRWLNELNATGLDYLHAEEDYIDFKKDHLLPHRHSQQGPGMAVADINGDGLEDVFVGGASGQSSVLFFQQPEGTFQQKPFTTGNFENTGVLFFDADNDGDNDLYCVSGSSEFRKNDRFYQDRLYRNNGQGEFVRDSAALPVIKSSGSCVVASDFDKDGDQDLFVGGRIRPGEYPLPPKSLLLENNGNGQFKDVIREAAPDLENIGMVTGALWTDFDNDTWTDLIVVGEFMPIVFFKNHSGKLKRYTPGQLGQTVGWWNSITGGDFDNDGDTDYVAGNLGLNSIYQATEEEPVCLYAKDFDGNGTMDPVLCRFIQGKEYPVHYRESLTDQMITLKKTLTSYDTFGRLTFHDIFRPPLLKDALVLKATQMASVYLENRGGGNFRIKQLPVTAQFAPAYGILPVDVDQDGNLDLLAVGNSYAPDPLTGRYDASLGNCLLGDGQGNFRDLDHARSGFLVKGDAKAVVWVPLGTEISLFLVTQNQDSLKAFARKYKGRVFTPAPDDVAADLYLTNGVTRRHEFYYGSGYLSQPSRSIVIPGEVDKIVVFNALGERREIVF